MSAVSASIAALGRAAVSRPIPVRVLQHALYRTAKADPGRRVPRDGTKPRRCAA